MITQTFTSLTANTPDVVLVDEESTPRVVSVLDVAYTFDLSLKEAFMTRSLNTNHC